MKYFTKEGLEKLKKELEYLKTAKRREIAERLKQAASYGDLSENFAYQEAKESQGFLEHRIREVENLIGDATIIEKDNNDKVQAGATVTVAKDLNKKRLTKEKFTIVGPAEADPLSGKISAESPLGEKMLNRKEGEIFQVKTPEGIIKYKIIKIE